jgi:hypothetical protein
MPEAAAPRATKTMVKPPTKSPMPVSIGRLVALAVPVVEAVAAAVVAAVGEKVAVAVAAPVSADVAVALAAVKAVSVAAVVVAVSMVCVVDPGSVASCPRAESSAAERPETMER